MPAVAYQEMRRKGMVATGATSAEMRGGVLAARARQSDRGSVNVNIPPGRLREFCPLDGAGEKALEMAIRRLALSDRAHDPILKVARSIADIGGAEQIQAKHIAEAVQYRSLDREYWKQVARFIDNPGGQLRSGVIRSALRHDALRWRIQGGLG